MKRLFLLYSVLLAGSCFGMQSIQPPADKSESSDASSSASETTPDFAAASKIGECAICKEPLDGVRVVLACEHGFHEGCINEWRLRNGDSAPCPLCRRVISRPALWAAGLGMDSESQAAGAQPVAAVVLGIQQFCDAQRICENCCFCCCCANSDDYIPNRVACCYCCCIEDSLRDHYARNSSAWAHRNELRCFGPGCRYLLLNGAAVGSMLSAVGGVAAVLVLIVLK